MQVDRLANLLGAAGLAVTDMVLAGVADTVGVSPSGAAALVVLSTSPGLSVTELGRRVGLSQSAAVRMVDSLQARDLVIRRSGARRGVSLEPTAAGRRAARDLLDARARRLATLFAPLDDTQRAHLARLLGTLLASLYGEIGDADLLCRLCDRDCCTRDDICPVGQAERDHQADRDHQAERDRRG
jgi:DNA-binding MarR family transcriptional regulator